MALHASIISLREAMDKMNGLRDLPCGTRRTILIRTLRIQDAPNVLVAVLTKLIRLKCANHLHKDNTG